MLSSTDFIHQEANLPMLCDRRTYHAQIQGFKFSNDQKKCATNPYRTRAFEAPILKYNIIHTASYQRSIEVYVSQEWNELKADLRNSESISVFKKAAKELLQAKIPKNKQNIYE